jgi:hypothetical protein
LISAIFTNEEETMATVSVKDPQVRPAVRPFTDKQTNLRRPDVAQPAPLLSAADAAELAARRAAQAQLEARLRGWKAIVVWYVVWSVLTGIAAISALSSGQVGTSLMSALVCGLSALYARYLFNGGRRRVWFVIW